VGNDFINGNGITTLYFCLRRSNMKFKFVYNPTDKEVDTIGLLLGYNGVLLMAYLTIGGHIW